MPVDGDAHLRESRVSTELVLDGFFLKVSRDQVRLPDGAITTREFIRHPGAVMIIPLLDDGSLLMERQYRYPMAQVMLEFPAGKLEAGEQALVCAQRELAEETGYRAVEWARACRIHNACA